jgi:hypothetical protein
MKKDEPLSEVKRRVEDLAIRRAEAVVESLATIATDKSASARDRATAGSAVLRAGGFFGAKTEPTEKELWEMSAAEIAAKIDTLERTTTAATGTEEPDTDEDKPGLFD